MKPYSRRKESLKSGVYVLTGVIALSFISVKLQALNQEDETIVINKEVVEQLPISQEMGIELNIDKIYEYSTKPLNEENIMELLKNHVLGGIYLEKVSINENASIHNAILTYVVEEDVPSMNKTRKDQIALVDTSILMSLYPDLDVIKVNIIVESDIYSEAFYRLDLEDYFGVNIAAQGEKNTFERIANEFMDSSLVSQYVTMKHPYDSFMGDEITNFYKMNFPIIHEEEIFPYIDEELETELVEEYGHKLFLQGLAYEHSLMNYYSIYRLVEYYGTPYSEQIMLELARCATKTQDQRVQEACQEVIDLLVPLKEGVKVFGRFNENELEGGKKLYKITESGLQVLAKWQGEVAAGLKIVSTSPSGEYILCEAVTLEQRYRYIISCKEKEKMILDEKSVFSNGLKSGSELMNLISMILEEKSIEQSFSPEEIHWDWYLGNLMRITIDQEIELIYNVQTDEIQSKQEYMTNLGLEEVEQYLKETFEVVNESTLSDKNAKAMVKKYTVDGEILTVYAYDNVTQKNIELAKGEGQVGQKNSKMWSQGTVMIYYNGNHTEIIKALNQLLL